MENIIIKHLKDKDKKNFENSKRKESCQIQEILNEVTRTSHQELWRPGGSGQPNTARPQLLMVQLKIFQLYNVAKLKYNFS